MTRIKICGLTNIEDALAAYSFGADVLGFIGVAESPRHLDPHAYTAIATKLPIFARRVVVVSRPEDGDDYLAEYVQHYLDPLNPDAFRRGSQWRIRAFRIRDNQSLESLAAYTDPVGAVLLDTFHPDKMGGSGEPFDWRLAALAREFTDKPIILAGGLTPENVADALEMVRPFAVDVSSGVEFSPGLKDHDKLRAFIKAVRAWDVQQM